MPTYYCSPLGPRAPHNPYCAWFRSLSLLVAVLFPLGFTLMACNGDDAALPAQDDGVVTITIDDSDYEDGDTYDFGDYYPCSTNPCATVSFEILNETGASLSYKVTITDAGTDGSGDVDFDFAGGNPISGTISDGASKVATLRLVNNTGFYTMDREDELKVTSSSHDEIDGFTLQLVGYASC